MPVFRWSQKDFDWDGQFGKAGFRAFNLQKAEMAASIARDSYMSEERSSHTLDFLEFQDVQMTEVDHMQAVAAWKPLNPSSGFSRVFVVAFRGSDETEDWLHNIDFRLHPFRMASRLLSGQPPLEVHRGFLGMEKSYEEAMNEVRFQQGELNRCSLSDILVDEQIKCGSRFFIIGHSLGGAIATIFALSLIYKHSVPAANVQVYTFGAPPIAGRNVHAIPAFERDIDLVRIINTQDPVAGPEFHNHKEEEAQGGRLPSPPYRLLGLHHFGREIRFSPRQMTGFYDQYQALAEERYSSRSFNSVHFMNSYLAALRCWRDNPAGAPVECDS